ncbi:MAG: polymerase family protein [Frondihabitans sp.]|nr:polymerase family protein [Frondihabitans sp.]
MGGAGEVTATSVGIMTTADAGAATRFVVLWCPDWPVFTHANAEHLPLDAPIALLEKGAVFACNAAARADGVKRGLRHREAQARCPELQMLDYDAALDTRAFEPVLAALEELLPGLHPIRPGSLAVRARGPARYYGGEREAALVMLSKVTECGVPSARVGIADGLFAAERAARWAPAGTADPITIVPPDTAAAFLAPLPIALLEQPELAALLPRLGIRTLGQFAALGAEDVAARFGPGGVRLHALAGGKDPRSATPRIPPRDQDVVIEFEPPLEGADQVAFGIRAASEQFVAALLDARLVCTALRVELVGEEGEVSERVWLHPRSFTASEVVDRARWQLQRATRSTTTQSELTSAVARVRLSPDAVDPVGAHEHGLWGAGADELVHSGFSRVQGLLGHEGVLTAKLAGGRTSRERQTLVPWGDRPIAEREPRQPWPGALPSPAPATVYEPPRPLQVEDADGRAVTIDKRGKLSGSPAVMVSQAGARRVLSTWAGPWSVEQRWWDTAAALDIHRFQVVDASGEAWLLVLDGDGWWAEGRYD